MLSLAKIISALPVGSRYALYGAGRVTRAWLMADGAKECPDRKLVGVADDRVAGRLPDGTPVAEISTALTDWNLDWLILATEDFQPAQWRRITDYYAAHPEAKRVKIGRVPPRVGDPLNRAELLGPQGEFLGYDESRVAFPTYLDINVTNRCNLRCFMCATHRNDPPGGGNHPDLSDEVFARLDEQIAAARTVMLGGGGAPFVARSIAGRIAAIRQLNPAVRLQAFTNALVFASDAQAARFLPQMNHLVVSLNGTSAYERIMVGGRFERAQKALANIRRSRETTGRPEQFDIDLILMRANYADLRPAIELAKEVGADLVHLKDFWVHEPAMAQQSLRHDPRLAEQLREEIEKASAVGVPLWCGVWPELSTNPSTAVAAGEPPLCRRPWTDALVGVDGTIRLCCEGFTAIGNLKEKSFAEIWRGDEAGRYRQGLLTGRYYKDCAVCKYIRPGPTEFYETYRKKKPGS